jgi:hypothetical protein
VAIPAAEPEVVARPSAAVRAIASVWLAPWLPTASWTL